MPDLPLMPLADAHDALSELATQFHNEMLRAGIKEMPARGWAEAFRSWIDAYDFERRWSDG